MNIVNVNNKYELEQHLKDRHMDIDLHMPIVSDHIATFLLYNLSGQIVGYQRYTTMNLLKLTIANGPEMGGSLYLNKDKICGFTPIICRLGPASEYGKEKGSNVLMECHRSYEVEEKVEDICKMIENSDGYLQITSMLKKE